VEYRNITEVLAHANNTLIKELVQLTIFLYTAERGSVYQSDIKKDLGITGASCSRNLKGLGACCARSRDRQRRSGLLQARPDTRDTRANIITLTKKGESYYKEFLK